MYVIAQLRWMCVKKIKIKCTLSIELTLQCIEIRFAIRSSDKSQTDGKYMCALLELKY